MVFLDSANDERSYLKNSNPYSNNYITFDDSAKENFVGKSQLDYPGLSCLNDSFMVDGFTTNIISIIQLYDQE